MPCHTIRLLLPLTQQLLTKPSALPFWQRNSLLKDSSGKEDANLLWAQHQSRTSHSPQSPAFTTDASDVRATTSTICPSSLPPSQHTTSAPSFAPPTNLPRLTLSLCTQQKQRIQSRDQHNLSLSITITSLYALSLYPSIHPQRLLCIHLISYPIRKQHHVSSQQRR